MVLKISLFPKCSTSIALRAMSTHVDLRRFIKFGMSGFSLVEPASFLLASLLQRNVRLLRPWQCWKVNKSKVGHNRKDSKYLKNHSDRDVMFNLLSSHYVFQEFSKVLPPVKTKTRRLQTIVENKIAHTTKSLESFSLIKSRSKAIKNSRKTFLSAISSFQKVGDDNFNLFCSPKNVRAR